MSEQEELTRFAEDLFQEAISASHDYEDASFLEDHFTWLATEYLSEAGEIEDADICYYRAYGLKVNGYSIDSDLGRLSIFTTIMTQSTPPSSVGKLDVETAFRRAVGFVRKAFSNHYLELEESSPAFDMTLAISEAKSDFAEIRVYLLTDGITTVAAVPEEEIEGIKTVLQIWDIERLFRLHVSGRRQETIEIDFAEKYGIAISCLRVPSTTDDYQAYLAVIPGEVLAGIYRDFGPRLLEQNVRSFLQARGAVNQGIRKTILDEPHRFLAYNNGITATAERVDFGECPEGNPGIIRIRNLQIVNGGQTTASLYHTQLKDKANLEGVHVQAKLAVVDTEQLDTMVPLISRYANSQNKVNEADFSANDPYHIGIEELSRTVWAPAPEGTKEQTKWFYERARGQYADAKNRERTPARKRQFMAIHLSRQKFTKTDLAKFAHSWDGLPHIVSRGAQKNFREFTIRLAEEGNNKPDVQHFQQIIAKAIFFRGAERLISALKFGGYRANIVTYTISYLTNRSGKRIDLGNIWKQQGLSSGLEAAINTVAPRIWEVITAPPGGRNVTEWCKKEECWKAIKNLEIDLPPEFWQELGDKGQEIKRSSTAQLPSHSMDPEILSPEEEEEVRLALQISAETWFQVASWAKEANELQGWQRSLAYSLGVRASREMSPSPKQAKQGLKLLRQAMEKGFQINEAFSSAPS